MRLLIAVIDNKTNDLNGLIYTHKNEVAAVRMFDDACRSEHARHIEDQELWVLGALLEEPEMRIITEIPAMTDENNIVIKPAIPLRKLLMSGHTWLAMKNQQETK